MRLSHRRIVILLRKHWIANLVFELLALKVKGRIVTQRSENRNAGEFHNIRIIRAFPKSSILNSSFQIPFTLSFRSYIYIHPRVYTGGRGVSLFYISHFLFVRKDIRSRIDFAFGVDDVKEGQAGPRCKDDIFRPGSRHIHKCLVGSC